MKSELCIMDHTGDTKLTWDAGNKDEVAAARKTFKTLKKKGYLAFEVKKGGKKGEAIDSFDPDAEKIIMTPMLAGG